MADKVDLWHYEITMTDGTKRECDAIGGREHEEFLIWDDVFYAVLQLRREKVDEVRRSADPVGQQDVEDAAGDQHV
jgi:hypothetical protein